ncbi:MAG: trypsin-like peptidase domain-containing protein [Pirellulales bacterium]|nr:trypsin-like peptidase domain-containing protein [Pirellulales bacterium]
MVSLQAALVATILSGSPDTVLLDFYADWCGPCRAMGPTIEALVEKGYPVRKVNIDQHRDLAARFGVKSVPCYVMVAGGREVDRVVGGTTLSRLETMCRSGLSEPAPPGPMQTAPPPLPKQVPTVAAQDAPASRTPVSIPAQQSGPPLSAVAQQALGEQPSTQAAQPPAASTLKDWQQSVPGWTVMGSETAPTDAKLIAASVRLRVEDPDGYSWGSGTIIDARDDEALILTCAHVFRDSQGKGRIEVDLFGPTPAKQIPGRLICYDLQHDVGLLSVRTPGPVVAARVAPPGYRVDANDTVVSVGCNNGDRPSARHSRVAARNKIQPPSVKVAGLPVEGRSGGGLFSREGLVIGVCYAADPQDGEGLYAELSSIHGELDRARLSCIYRNQPSGPASLPPGPAPRASLVAVAPPPMPKRMPAAPTGSPAAVISEVSLNSTPAKRWQSLAEKSAGSPLTASEQAALDEIRQRLDEGAEVICVIRSRTDPKAKSEIIMLDRASPGFLSRLAAQTGARVAR